jgi:hypothetical protein
MNAIRSNPGNSHHLAPGDSPGARWALPLALALLGLLAAYGYCQPTDPLASGPQWRPPDPAQVRAEAFAWLEQNRAGRPALTAAGDLWTDVGSQPTGTELLDCLAGTFALLDQDAAGLVRLCSGPKGQLLLPDQPWLGDPQTPPLVADNMRLFYGRWLVQEELFDEALLQLSGLGPDDVVAPACLLFYQGVVHHKLLDMEAGLEVIGQLLAAAEQSPQRYVDVAHLMQQDLLDLDEKSLDHIARRMDDIRRRLDLGRAGEKVRHIEDGVIASLDELIKELEEQQQQQQQRGSNSGDSIRSPSPLPDSRPVGGRGPGNVADRNIGAESGWGDLPPRQREEVLQQIGREFPAHYRDVIEQYFRRLAAEGGDE